MNRYEMLTSDGEIADVFDAPHQDQVAVALADGDTVHHATANGLGGAEYEVVENAVLLVRRTNGGDVLRAYSPHGWVSVTGKPRFASARKAGYTS